MNSKELDYLSEKLVTKLDDILEKFNVKPSKFNDRYSFPCPVHGGDNPNGCSIYIKGERPGCWKCWTHCCEDTYGKGILGFVHGLRNSRKQTSFGETVRWAKNYVGGVISIPEDETEVDFKEFLNIIDNFNKEVEENIVKVSREEFRKKISIAPEFYIKRGYQKSTLNKFDVGLCLDKTERYFSRVVVPIYDEAGEYVIASMARSTQPYCKLCKKYHYENRHCPRNRLEEIWGEKWLNSSGWRRNTSLYNYWNAKKFIRESQTVVLVEGPGDVWRLDEAGIYNAVALYGMNMGPDQKVILEKSGAMKIIIAMDNDAAGLEGKKKIVQECSRMYNLEFINLKEHDIGDTGVEEIKEMFKENS